MGEIIKEFFLEIVGKELCVFFCSMLPVIELRGAIPMAFALGLPWWQAYLISVLGNLLPVPFILLLINLVIKWMSSSKVTFFNKIANFLLKKVEKNRERIEKYSFWGLFLFVAIPLPMTGAWTGSLVAAVVGVKPLKAFLSVLLGVLLAGVIVTLIVYGGIGFLAWLL
ncbi:MAG: small multi-drug export protein [Clostridia bacterium]|nr:small multi-drug export protein [Clostridia bacterium]